MEAVAVLGGGCAGLSAARRLRELGRPVVLLEAEDHVGGLAGGVRLGRDVYEYGPHIFHTTDPAILEDVKALMGDELLPYERTIQIKFLGNYFKFPLAVRDVLLKLPVTTVIAAGLSFLWHFTKGACVAPAQENSETLLRRYYGDVLYRLFFRDYIERVWGVPPSGFSPSFARERIPRLNILETLDKLASWLREKVLPAKPVSTEGYVETLEGRLWTTKAGFSRICERMEEDLKAKGGTVLLNARVVSIARDGARAARVEYEQGGERRSLPCSAVINTLPISEAARMFSPGLGEEAERAAASLRSRAIVFVGLKVRRPKVLRASFMYFREHSFNRITDLSHFGFELDPGTTLLVAEISCDPKDPVWKDDALAATEVTDDLVREKVLERSEIAATHVFRAAHAYPMYLLGYEKALKTALDAFARIENAETAGRQGRFAYVNTHIAMKMGRDAAERLHSRLP